MKAIKALSYFTLSIFIFFTLLPMLSLILQINNIELLYSIVKDIRTYKAIWNTVIIAFSALLINIIIGTPAAQILARRQFFSKNIILGILILSFIIPDFVTSMGIHYSFIKFNLVENILGVILIHSVHTIPYYIRAVMTGYQTINEDYEHMGFAFGAKKYKRFFYIILPQLIPSILVGSSLVITVSFAQYLNTFIIGGGKVMTISILMFPYLNSGNIAVGSFFGIIFILVTILLLVMTENIVKLVSKRNYMDIRND